MKKEGKTLIKCMLIFITLAILLNISSANSFTFESQPNATNGKDSYIRQGLDTNYAASETLRIGKTVSALEFRGLIEFNVSNITSDNTVTSAILQVYTNSSVISLNRTMKLYRIISQWNETEVGWNNRTSSYQWSSAGGDYLEEINSLNFSNSSGIYYNFTITSLARGWVNASYNNSGIILISSDAGNGDIIDLASSDNPSSIQRPKIIIEYTSNAVPAITNFSADTSLSAPKQVGQLINFTAVWNDLESNPAKLFVCNSSNINFSGCKERTFCNTSLNPSSPSSCSYTVLSTDNRTTPFYIAMCDSGSNNCSSANQSNFYINHLPNVLVVQPNGGETLNQSLGNYTIKFNVSDPDPDLLKADIYYGLAQNSTNFSVVSSLNLSIFCTDSDSNISTTNNCSYSWNTTGIYGNYYLTIIINDSFSSSNDSSDNVSYIRSITDNTPPNVSAQWISESDISSGETIQFFANVSDPNINTIWLSINTTPQINITMNNYTSIIYNASWTAISPGIYKFRIYANDTLGNLNDTSSQDFTIRKPNATAQAQNAPSTALPFSLIRIAGELNSIDVLNGVYAYLNVPSGFVFISNYSQNASLGNFSQNQTKTAIWIVSAPITEANYTLNITYHDSYGNSWNSSNFYVQVTSVVGGGYFVSVSGYPEVQTSSNYYAEARFTQSGTYSTPDSIKLSLYDPVGNLIVGPVDMALKSAGIYNYTYSVPGSATTGQWETRINATKSSANYQASQFWKLVGALFDLGNITIISSGINNLNISVTATNIGNTTTDLILSWNLTRTDNAQVLDSGGETFAVSATPVTKYYRPNTTYVGQVRITFLGRYSGTETAGAFETFTTTSGICGDGTCNNGETCSSCSSDCGTCPSQPSVGGGGGGAAAEIKPIKKHNLTIKVENNITLTKNIEKIIYLEVNNTGEFDFGTIMLEIENISKDFYTIVPLRISSLKKGESKKFEIKFLVKEFTGKWDFNFIAKSKEFVKREPAKLVILSIEEYLLKEVLRLENRIRDLKSKTKNEVLLKEFENCESIVEKLKINIEKEEFINAETNIKNADPCINKIEDKIKKEVPEKEAEKTQWISILIWLLIAVIIAGLLFAIYKFYRKLKIIDFMKNKEIIKETPLKTMNEGKFEERLNKIKERLNG